jgi:hypothetical protein
VKVSWESPSADFGLETLRSCQSQVSTRMLHQPERFEVDFKIL